MYGAGKWPHVPFLQALEQCPASPFHVSRLQPGQLHLCLQAGSQKLLQYRLDELKVGFPQWHTPGDLAKPPG